MIRSDACTLARTGPFVSVRRHLLVGLQHSQTPALLRRAASTTSAKRTRAAVLSSEFIPAGLTEGSPAPPRRASVVFNGHSNEQSISQSVSQSTERLHISNSFTTDRHKSQRRLLNGSKVDNSRLAPNNSDPPPLPSPPPPPRPRWWKPASPPLMSQQDATI